MNLDEAKRTASRKLCKVCWSHLVAGFDRDEAWVKCSHDETHTGYVSKDFVKRKRSEDHFDGLDAKVNLADALGIEISKPTEKDLEEFIKANSYGVDINARKEK